MNVNPTLNPFAPSADPRDAIAYCEAALRKEQWFQKANIREHWPVTTAEAARLLCEGGEYAIDAEGLADLVERGLIDRPSVGEDGLCEWDAQDLSTACARLECRAQWWPTPSGHDPKKHPTRILLEQARESGELASVAHAGPIQFDVRHLIQLLVLCPALEGRLKIAALLEAILEVDHEVIL